MAIRTVAVKLQADISGYTAGLKSAAAQTRSFASGLDAGVTKNKSGLDGLARGLGAVGLVAALGVAKAVSSFATFDAAMSNVQAATHESAANMGLLRDAAIDAGSRTSFSATEAAGAVENLAKAGISTADILGGGLSGALSLAAAGELDVGDAAETAATAMTQFKLSGKDVPHIADLLAAAAGKAQGEVSDMAMALKQSGLVASQFGLTVEDTVGVLAEFASAGLIGSDAGTSLRTMLLRLANPSAEAADTLKQLGISVYDAGGNMVKPTVLAGELSAQMSKLDPATRNAALATIFGSDAIRAASILYTDGAVGAAKWKTAVDDAGYAAETAAIKQDNLKGDLEKLSGAFDTLMIKAGSGSDGPLRQITQSLTGLVDIAGNVPGPVQAAGLGIAGFTAIVGLGGAGAIKAVQGYTSVKSAITTLGISGKTAGLALGGIGAVLTVATLAVGAYAKSHAEAKARVDALTDAIKADSGAIGENSLALVAHTAAQSGLLAKADALGISADLYTKALLGQGDAAAIVQARLDAIGKTAGPMGAGQRGTAGDVKTLTDALGDQSTETGLAITNAKLEAQALGPQADATTVAAAAAAVAAAAAKKQADATAEVTAAAQGGYPVIESTASAFSYLTEKQQENEASLGATKSAVDGLVSSLHILNGDAIGVAESTIAFKDAVHALTGDMDKSSRSLSINTDGGRKNQTALIGLIKDANSHAEAVGRQTHSVDKATAAFNTDITAIRKAATAAGLNKVQVDKLILSYSKVPAKKATTVTAPGLSKQLTDSAAYKKWLDSLPRSKRTLVTAPGLYEQLGNSKSFNAYLARQPKSTRSAVSAPGLSPNLARIKEFNNYLNTVDGKNATSTVTMRRITQNIITHSQSPTPMFHATGGLIDGPGTGTSDSILSWLSNREFVVNARATADNLALLHYINDGGRIQGYARGSVASERPTDWGKPQLITGVPSMTKVYVENPWTGEYMLARTRSVADGVVTSAAQSANRKRG